MAVTLPDTGSWIPIPRGACYVDLTQATEPVVKPEGPSTHSCSLGLTASHARDEAAFDFGRGDPLPAQPRRYRTPLETTIYDEGLRRHAPVFQSLGRSNDRNLLRYLASRHISEGFLREIDMFLDDHLELAKYCPDFVERYNSKDPLAAYRYFIKGYTRPARYIPRFLPEAGVDLTIIVSSMTSMTASKTDEELVDFFDGYDYRWDILAKIDQEVGRLCIMLQHGMRLKHDQRLLVVLALYGNPADAYKHYEYNYQTDWLPHRYVPEHVVLSEMPKSALAGPTAHYMDQSEYSERTHLSTRAKMARANDAGVDVLDVLLQDLRAACVMKGVSRYQIQSLIRKAERELNKERAHATGKDIVNLVMKMVPVTKSRHAASQRRTRDSLATGDRLSTLRSALGTLKKQETALRTTFEQAERRGDSGRDDYLAFRAVRDSRMRVERQCLSEMVQNRRASGKWSNNRCREIMWQYSKDQVDVLALSR